MWTWLPGLNYKECTWYALVADYNLPYYLFCDQSDDSFSSIVIILDSDRRWFLFFFHIRDESSLHIRLSFFFSSFLFLFFLFSLWLSLPGENFRRLNDFYLTIRFQYIVLIIFFFFFISFSFIQLFISAVTSRTVFYSIKSKFQFKIREFIQRVTPRYSR